MAESAWSTTIDVGRFSDATTIKDSMTFRGDIIAQVEAVMTAICKHINKAYIFTGKPQREERWDYPLTALRELVINMIVHRDYRATSDAKIKIFDDHIEFVNPGEPYQNQAITALISGRYFSALRNKQIARMFKEMNFIEHYGSGVSRVIKECVDYGLPKPKFHARNGMFQVIVWLNQTTPKTTPKTELEEKILEIMRAQPEITREALAQELSLSINTVKEYILRLRNKQVIERVGGRKQGYWKILEEGPF